MAKRDYDNNYPSVTQILGVLRKISLEMWFKYNTAKFCDEASNRGKLIGTQIHEAIQSFIETGKASVETEYNEEVTNALKSFMLFRKENPEIELKASELPLTSELHKFNGTIDCIGNGVMIDWKTGMAKEEEKPVIYDEYKYQVSAYVYLYNEIKNENIDKAIIVCVAKDKIAYNMYEMNKEEIDGCFNEVFLSALKIKNYETKRKQLIKEMKKNAKI